jgi:hypothetical protein
MQTEATVDAPKDLPEDAIPRTETGLRVLYTLLFAVIAQLVAWILAVLVAVAVVSALVTRREPHPRLRAFGDGVARYLHQMGRYVTYNDRTPPFPFSDLPAAPRR